jgi:sterol desaturase/sphingolipid hydroxylase (fatty acid hydroxylase superfamily)
MTFLFTIFLAFIYGNIIEWVLHRYILHGWGKNKKSPFSFHWYSHHKICRKNNNYDPYYNNPKSIVVSKEKLGLYFLVILHIPVYFISPVFFIAVALYAIYYYRTHKRMHLDTQWGKKHFPWHRDHHMGRDQDKNWGVTHQWVDKLMGTRKTWKD